MPPPLGPVTPTRSPRSTCRSTGPRVKSPRRTTAPRATATTLPERGAAAMVYCSSHSFRGSADLRQSLDQSLRLPSLRGLLLGLLDAKVSTDLVVVLLPGGRFTHAGIHPGPLHAPAFLETRLAVGVLLEGLPRMPSGHLALGQVGVVAAAVDTDGLLRQIQLDHRGDAPGQELPVVRHHHHADPLAGDEPLQPGQPVQVQVIRRLVQQQHVEAGQQQCRQPDAGGLSAGQAGHRHRRDRPRAPIRSSSFGCVLPGRPHRGPTIVPARLSIHRRLRPDRR